MNKRFACFLVVSILAVLAACLSPNGGLSPDGGAPATATPEATVTSAPPTATVPPTPTETPDWLPEGLRGVQERLVPGGFELVGSQDGYYEIIGADGQKVEGVKVFEDGSTELTMMIDGKEEVLVTGAGAVTSHEGKLVWGLRDYVDGQWSEPDMMSAIEMGDFIKIGGLDSGHKLVLLMEHERTQAMVDTMRAERDRVMTPGRCAVEWNGVTGFNNFVTYVAGGDTANDSEDIKAYTVGDWQKAVILNRSSDAKGVSGTGPDLDEGRYQLTFVGSNGIEISGRMGPLSPMQYAWGEGMFVVQVGKKNGSGYDLSEPAIHVSVVLAKSDGEYQVGSSLKSVDTIRKFAPYIVDGQKRGELASTGYMIHTTNHWC
ncbi:MAG: hypothetical protein ACOYYU_16740 [Chloroflexota bacterium]